MHKVFLHRHHRGSFIIYRSHSVAMATLASLQTAWMHHDQMEQHSLIVNHQTNVAITVTPDVLSDAR